MVFWALKPYYLGPWSLRARNTYLLWGVLLDFREVMAGLRAGDNGDSAHRWVSFVLHDFPKPETLRDTACASR